MGQRCGKTTVFNLLTGVYKPDMGQVILDGENITGCSTIEINKAGVARTFQNIRLFKNMSVLDNVNVVFIADKYSTFAGIFSCSYFKTERMNEQAYEILEVFGLEKNPRYYPNTLR